jgi:hypothetical protein
VWLQLLVSTHFLLPDFANSALSFARSSSEMALNTCGSAKRQSSTARTGNARTRCLRHCVAASAAVACCCPEATFLTCQQTLLLLLLLLLLLQSDVHQTAS